MWQTVRSVYARLPIVRELRSTAESAHRIAYEQETQRRLHQETFVGHLLAQDRYAHPGRLNRHEFQVCSQNGEDGILHEIFQRIGVSSETFVEIGVGDGRENNTAFLLMQGWRGWWVDGDENAIAAIRRGFREEISGGRLKVSCGYVTAENAEEILAALGATAEVDVLSLDIDRNTYWVWAAMRELRPRVAVIEYNATLPPSIDWKVPYDPAKTWNETAYFGASLLAYERLGRKRGYLLVGCDVAGVNAFFVREDVAGGKFAGPFDAAFHYEPPRYFLVRRSGHPPAVADRGHD